MITLMKKKALNDWIDFGEFKLKIDYPTMEQEQKLQSIIFNSSKDGQARFIEYVQNYVRYVIKDWEGIEEKCELVNNELEEKLWWALARDTERAIMIYTKIEQELQLLDSDKKKFS